MDFSYPILKTRAIFEALYRHLSSFWVGAFLNHCCLVKSTNIDIHYTPIYLRRTDVILNIVPKKAAPQICRAARIVEDDFFRY